MKALATMYQNGIIRDELGVFVAFYDEANSSLTITGGLVRKVMDSDHAMDLVAEWLRDVRI